MDVVQEFSASPALLFSTRTIDVNRTDIRTEMPQGQRKRRTPIQIWITVLLRSTSGDLDIPPNLFIGFCIGG